MTPYEKASRKPKPIAPWWHLIGYLLILAYLTASGFHLQHVGNTSGPAAPAGQLAAHAKAMQNYVIDIVVDWAILAYCWFGVWLHGGNLATLTGGRWTAWKGILADVAIALPFWILWEAIAYGVHLLLGPSKARSIGAILPQSLFEVLVWIVVSVNAGFCEEIQSRGYLQLQLYSLSGSIVAAVLGQALVFGLGHSYQGWKQVIVISVLGVLYGALAAWRRNLRANMVAHAWADVWEGWLKSVIWK